MQSYHGYNETKEKPKGRIRKISSITVQGPKGAFQTIKTYSAKNGVFIRFNYMRARNKVIWFKRPRFSVDSQGRYFNPQHEVINGST